VNVEKSVQISPTIINRTMGIYGFSDGVDKSTAYKYRNYFPAKTRGLLPCEGNYGCVPEIRKIRR